MKFIDWLKMDFNRVSAALQVLLNRDISKGMLVLWYLIWLPLTIWFIPLVYYFETRYIPRKIKKIMEEEA